MAILRKNLVGVVHVAGGVYAAGDELPEGAHVSGGLIEVPAPVVEAPRRRRASKSKGVADVGDS